jgi:hypothetical protein
MAREASRDFNRDANRLAVEASRAAVEASREVVEAARVDARRFTEEFRDGFRDFTPMAPMPAMAPMPPMPTFTPMPAIAPMAFGRASDGFHVPAPQFIQGDPADSLWRFAQDILNRGDYGRAAQTFKEIAQVSEVGYQEDLPYWEAFARYKIGTTGGCKRERSCEPRASKLIGTTTPSSGSNRPFYVMNGGRRGTGDGDVVDFTSVSTRPSLSAATLAPQRVAKANQAGTNTCDNDEMQVRREAMSALNQMDAATALPIIKRVLDKKDECTAELRSQAVSLLGRRGDGEAATLLAAAAKSDPSKSVRSQAISWLEAPGRRRREHARRFCAPSKTSKFSARSSGRSHRATIRRPARACAP